MRKFHCFWEPPAHSKYGDDLILKPCSQICRPPPPSNFITRQNEEPTFGGKSPQRPSGLLSAPFQSCISEMPELRSRLSPLEEGSSGSTGDGWQVGLSTANCTQTKHIWLSHFRASEPHHMKMKTWDRGYTFIIQSWDSTRKIMCFVLYFCFCVKGWQLKTTGSPAEEHPKDQKVLFYGRKMSP